MTPKRFLLVIIAIVVLIAAAGVGYYLWSHHDTFDRNSTKTDTKGEDLTEADIDKIIEAASKHIILPEGEDPVAAKIVDVDELVKTQPFYRGAINGDILLIYQASAKAIIYSPSRDMLVNVGPIIMDEETTGTAPVEAQASEEGSTDDTQ